MKTTFAPTSAAYARRSAQLPYLLQPAWLRLLHECYPALAWAGWLHVVLLLLALALWPLDPRTVTGLNVWVKPLKFCAAGVVYLWTLGWLLADLPAAAQRAARRVGRLAAGSMAGEILLIFLQAARGTTSHFNVGSAFDGLVFGLMGVLIVVNTVAAVWALGLTLRHRPFGSVAWVGGVRLGLLLFLVGSAVGGQHGRPAGAHRGRPRRRGGPALPGLEHPRRRPAGRPLPGAARFAGAAAGGLAGALLDIIPTKAGGGRGAVCAGVRWGCGLALRARPARAAAVGEVGNSYFGPSSSAPYLKQAAA